MGRSLGRGLSLWRQRAAGEKFFRDRLGYPAISMNFKTESFTYVIFLTFTHFVISLTCNLLMIGQFHHYLVKGYNSGIFSL